MAATPSVDTVEGFRAALNQALAATTSVDTVEGFRAALSQALAATTSVDTVEGFRAALKSSSGCYNIGRHSRNIQSCPKVKLWLLQHR